MKRYSVFFLVLVCVLLLNGCCSHTWTEASCEMPTFCPLCEKTKGEALGHDWTEARCLEPKTCARCGKTEGEALGHDLVVTCEEPETCTRCAMTQGEAPGHRFGNWESQDTQMHRTCETCGQTQTAPLDRVQLLQEKLTRRWTCRNVIYYPAEASEPASSHSSWFDYKENLPYLQFHEDGTVTYFSGSAMSTGPWEVEERPMENGKSLYTLNTSGVPFVFCSYTKDFPERHSNQQYFRYSQEDPQFTSILPAEDGDLLFYLSISPWGDTVYLVFEQDSLEESISKDMPLGSWKMTHSYTPDGWETNYQNSTLEIYKDGTFTANLPEPISGTWKYLPEAAGSHDLRYVLSFTKDGAYQIINVCLPNPYSQKFEEANYEMLASLHSNDVHVYFRKVN